MMKNVQNTSIKLLALLLLSLPMGCKEFYDEEFEELPLSAQVENGDDVSYQADLNPTDPNIADMSGSARVDIQGDQVNVSVQLQGIPDNLVQVHYGFIAAACSSITVAIPVGSTGSKDYNLTETSTLNSLRQDLATSGANTSNGDIDLSNKSIVVKAFSSVTTATTGTTGTAAIIACGDMNVSTDQGTDTGTNTGTTTGTTGTDFGTTTGTTTGTDFGTTTGIGTTTGGFGTATGGFGTTTGGDFGTTTGGDFGTTTGGDFGTTTGGFGTTTGTIGTGFPEQTDDFTGTGELETEFSF